MDSEANIPPYLRVIEESAVPFGGSRKDLRRCAAAVPIAALAYMNGHMSLEGPATYLPVGDTLWEAIEMFDGHVLFHSDTSYMLVRADASSGQLCRLLTFAARYDDPGTDSELPEDVLYRYQSVVALQRLVTAET